MGNKRFWSRDWHEQKDCSGHRVELNWVSWRQKAVLRGGYGRELSAVNSTPDPRPSPQALMTDGNDGLHPPVPTGFQFRWYWWEALVQEEQSGRDTLCFSSHVSREEVHICFQASPCKSASSARQTAEPKGIQAFLKFQMVKIPLRLVAIIPNLDCPSLYIRNYVCFQSPTLNPSYLRYVVSVFLTQPQLLKSVKKFLQYWE